MLIVLPILMSAFYGLISLGLWKGMNLEILVLISAMSVAVLFGISNYMFGTVGLSIIGEHRYYAKSIFRVGIVTLILSIIMSYMFQEFGAAFSFVVGELLLLVFFYSKYRATN